MIYQTNDDYVEISENYEASPALFREFNQQIPEGTNHAANKIWRNKEDRVVAIKCNCGGRHRVDENKFVWWGIDSPIDEILELRGLK